MVSLGHKKGFVFTILTLLLFLILISFAVALKNSSMDKSKPAGQTGSSRKVLYAWYDITENLQNTLGIKFEKNGVNLSVFDTLPPNNSNGLQQYYYFLTKYYQTGDLEFDFLDANNNTILPTGFSNGFTILPFGFNYSYPDIGQTERSIECPEDNCSAVFGMNYQYNFTNMTFDCDPMNCSCFSKQDGGCGNGASAFGWTPNKLLGSCLAGKDDCVNFSLNVMDDLNRSYQCPGQFCPYSAFKLDDKSTLSIEMSPCYFSLQLGGNDNENQVLESVRLHQPNNQNTPCNIPTLTSITFTFNTSNYYINFPYGFRVRDINYNISKQDSINLFGQ